MNFNDDFDNIIDGALSEYRDAEPLAGLENRALERLQLQAKRRPMLWWQWSAAGLTAAVLAIAVWMGLRIHAQRQTAPQIAHHDQLSARADERERQRPELPTTRNQGRGLRKAPSPPSTSNTADLFASSKLARAGSGGELAAGHTPVRSQFPAPTPLTWEEHALVALVRTNPDVVRNLTQSDGEITIAPIEIKPLAGDGSDTQGNN